MKIAGIGFRSGATVTSVLDAMERAGAAGLRHLAVPAAKRDDPLVSELIAQGFGVTPIPQEALARITTPTQSRISLQVYGTGSVAEACALAAGARSRLLIARVVSADRMATAALAETGDNS
ncbi:cobalamin biosynthesis protein [Paracoccus onubensis]|uniref:cobalamin biosynthesis protein n=1 Tax=Paracoccus onubensis TaxID=1675788 RepID=UPI00272F8632|nr:cobalamin biosynthesis protein [Paracoccus onubensis]MDP0926864.1 cobalamin biosynthesis protein [Paracoccus onubensis]